jgi:quercetin dioxygenase-like cupin family protein
MQRIDLRTHEVRPHQPEVLQSADGEGRAILIHLPAGEEMQDHQVHERAYVVVADGEVEVQAGPEIERAQAGTLFVFDPQERHEVRAASDARLLLVLAPWPGLGHPSTRPEVTGASEA